MYSLINLFIPLLIGKNEIQNVKYFSMLKLENKEDLDFITEKYNVFKYKLSPFNKYEITLNVKTGAVPKFYKLWSIYLALKSKVEIKIDHLVNSNILVPIDYSDWETP